jgi:hypothetical protein
MLRCFPFVEESHVWRYTVMISISGHSRSLRYQAFELLGAVYQPTELPRVV